MRSSVYLLVMIYAAGDPIRSQLGSRTAKVCGVMIAAFHAWGTGG